MRGPFEAEERGKKRGRAGRKGKEAENTVPEIMFWFRL